MTLSLTTVAQSENIRPLRNLAAELACSAGLPDETVKAVKQCVDEAVTNAVEHAYDASRPGTVALMVREVHDELEVVVSDLGQGFRPEAANGNGFGLRLIGELCDRCAVSAERIGGTRVEMLFSLGPARRGASRRLSQRNGRLVLARCDGGTGRKSTEGGDMGPKVREHMTDRPRCVTPDTRVSEAAELMASEDVGSLPILDGDKLTGVVTDRDIVIRAVATKKDPQGMPVREVATHDPVTVRADEDLSDALKLMATYQVRRLPVVDEDNRLVGVLAQADVAMGAKEKAVGEMVEEISQTPTGPRV